MNDWQGQNNSASKLWLYGISVGGLAPKFEAKLSHYKQLDVQLIRRNTKIEHSARTSKIAEALGVGDLE